MSLENAIVIAEREKKTIYRDGDTAVKVFDSDFLKSDILNEALNQVRIEETNLNIPGIRAIEMIDGKWAIVSDFIEGETLDKLMKENPDKFDEYLELFVDLQLVVHAQKSPLLNNLKIKMRRKIAETDLNATIRYELDTRLESTPKHNKVCHGDFNPSNVIITADGTPYILDWSHASQGNAAADAAITYLLFKLNGEDETAEKYLKLYSIKSDTAIQYIQKWLPIVAAAQSVKGKPEEKEMLLKWVDVVEYD
ncbi:MAG: phosphotransferase [Clostridia bacterium]|nr:phosphotransferase [Clostridia bacterium]